MSNDVNTNYTYQKENKLELMPQKWSLKFSWVYISNMHGVKGWRLKSNTLRATRRVFCHAGGPEANP